VSRVPQRFKQGDVAKIIKAAAAAGRVVVRIEVDKDGRIIVILANGKGQLSGEANCGDAQNEWDEVLK
jgi:hypothetical protein